MSMLRYRFSNERWGGGGGTAPLNHLALLLCKSVYVLYFTRSSTKFQNMFQDKSPTAFNLGVKPEKRSVTYDLSFSHLQQIVWPDRMAVPIESTAMRNSLDLQRRPQLCRAPTILDRSIFGVHSLTSVITLTFVWLSLSRRPSD